MFSKACEYGIRAAIYIAMQSLDNKRVSLKDITREINTPEAFTAKILQLLAKNNIITSVKGATGGFEISHRHMNKIMLSQIVSAVDGDAVYKGCGMGLKNCSEKKPCPVHDKFKIIRNELRVMLENTSLYELSTGLKDGLTYLKR